MGSFLRRLVRAFDDEILRRLKEEPERLTAAELRIIGDRITHLERGRGADDSDQGALDDAIRRARRRPKPGRLAPPDDEDDDED